MHTLSFPFSLPVNYLEYYYNYHYCFYITLVSCYHQGIGANFIPKVLDLSLVDRVETATLDESLAMAKALANQEGYGATLTNIFLCPLTPLSSSSLPPLFLPSSSSLPPLFLLCSFSLPPLLSCVHLFYISSSLVICPVDQYQDIVWYFFGGMCRRRHSSC